MYFTKSCSTPSIVAAGGGFGLKWSISLMIKFKTPMARPIKRARIAKMLHPD
jgi:hypothetical protein